MDKIGFIGFGQMGGTMLSALLKFEALSPHQVVVMTRTEAKLKDFLTTFPAVQVAHSSDEIGSVCQRVFICTGTREVKNVLCDLANGVRDIHVIIITGGIELRSLERVFKGRVTKIMPTMLIEVGEGITLVHHNRKALAADRQWIRNTFSRVNRIKEIPEEQMDLAADLTSCAPAFWAAIARHLIQTSLWHGDLTEADLKDLILTTLFGSSKLFMEKETNLSEFISSVATKGGITEEGVKVLDRGMPEIFNELLTVTLKKREIVKQQIRQQYGLE